MIAGVGVCGDDLPAGAVMGCGVALHYVLPSGAKNCTFGHSLVQGRDCTLGHSLGLETVLCAIL